MLTLALNPIVTNLLVVFFLLVCVSMILIVLIQRPQGGGLSGAFGAGGAGQGAGQTAFGTKTGDVLTWGTVSVFVVYLFVAVGLNFIARPDTSRADPNPALVAPGEEQPSGETLPPLEDAGDTGLPPLDRGDIPRDATPPANTGPETPAEPGADEPTGDDPDPATAGTGEAPF